MNTAIFINPHFYFCQPPLYNSKNAFERGSLQSTEFAASTIGYVMEGGDFTCQL